MPFGKRRKKRRRNYSVDDEDEDDEDTDEDFTDRGLLLLTSAEKSSEHRKRWGYDLKVKLTSDDFDKHFDELVDCIEGKDFRAQYIQETGFKKPIYFSKFDGLGLQVPSTKDFGVTDVRRLVGSGRLIDVVEVDTQKGSQMTLKEFVEYFTHPERKRLLNVLSLEFSKTKLDKLVEGPALVRELDWVELAWPQELRVMQTDATNSLQSMKYPKVQKYCLMSVADCYTDFHIDFGGTSVWYHVLKGEKVFWLAPPNDENFAAFQSWTLGGRQQKTFFGDLVEKCVRIRLKAGDTFMIPSGWIHAVYTPVDSLVFGGNFLHSFAIPMQLSVYEIERNTHVPAKFRYPFFLDMQWYVLERYYFALTGRVHRVTEEQAAIPVDNGDSGCDGRLSLTENAKFITDIELDGLNALLNWLQALPGSKRRVPKSIVRSDNLLNNFQLLLTMLTSIKREPCRLFYTVLAANRRQSTKTHATQLSSESETAATCEQAPDIAATVPSANQSLSVQDLAKRDDMISHSFTCGTNVKFSAPSVAPADSVPKAMTSNCVFELPSCYQRQLPQHRQQVFPPQHQQELPYLHHQYVRFPCQTGPSCLPFAFNLRQQLTKRNELLQTHQVKMEHVCNGVVPTPSFKHTTTALPMSTTPIIFFPSMNYRMEASTQSGHHLAQMDLANVPTCSIRPPSMPIIPSDLVPVVGAEVSV